MMVGNTSRSSSKSRDRWDRRYRYHLGHQLSDGVPHPYLLEHELEIPRNGHALDIAAGLGRNTFWLAQRSLHVTAIDISQVACDQIRKRANEMHLSIDVRCLDVENCLLPAGPFDLIVNTLFLERSLASQVKDNLVPGGLLIFSTRLVGGISSESIAPAFLLNRGELRQLFNSLEILQYREDPSNSKCPNAYLLARKPG